ncbi:PREDICTED: uncharacterized protein DDB_G0290301-like isoform X2 [Acromyrmex echinatior]|uniref:uncharacterized protein DDB_G0290301-like isoform X2 n=1 Tax=Acromyrmex echinatior TaxID=103372 RepID=UPI000580FF2C|nr:PREDICTED: uncharacterized protein DDB_G0290301-like isoform X2 [Acromyrmex echinatior]
MGKTNSSYLIEKSMEIYGKKHQTKRLIMDLTEEDVDIISISSQEGTQNQTMDNNKYASPERQEVSVEKRSPVLTTNRGINRVLYYPTLEIKEEQETIHKKHSENNENDEVEKDIPFLEYQSKNTQQEKQLVQSPLTKEIENWINIQKSKSKQIENLKAIYPNLVELLSNSNDLKIMNKTLEPINKLINHNNSGNEEVTRQFDLDTIKLDKTTINPIESEIGNIRHKVSQKNTCTTKQIGNKNKVNNCKIVVVQSQRYGKIVRRFIKMNNRTLKYFGLTNFPLQTDKKFQINVIRRLKRKQKVTLNRANQLAKKAIRKCVTKSLAATRKTARRQSKSIPTTEEKNETKINNIRRTMETSSETSSSDIGRQLEKDEKTLLQKLKNELKIKEEILLRIKRIKYMREITQQLEKENIRYKAVDKQTGQQLEITRTINRYNQLKNESTEYGDNLVIKDQAECDPSHVKIKDLRPEGYHGPQIFQTKYDLMEDRLTRRVGMVHTNDSTQQVEQLPAVKIKSSTPGMADENKKELSGKKRKISFSESNFMEEVQTLNEKKKKKEKKNKISSEALKNATASQTRGSDGKLIEEQTATSTNKQTNNKPKIISIEGINLIPKNLQQESSFEKQTLTVQVTKLPALNPTSTALLPHYPHCRSEESEIGNQLPESQPAESAVESQNYKPQIINNNQATATSSKEGMEKQNVEQIVDNNSSQEY